MVSQGISRPNAEKCPGFPLELDSPLRKQKGDCESWLFFFLEMYSKYFDDFTCWLPGERSLPFGLLFF